MTPETLTIKSDYGDDVEYCIHPHGAAEGFDLAPKIMGLMGAPVRAIAALAKSVGSGKVSLDAAPQTEDGPSEDAPPASAPASDLASDIEQLFGDINGREMSQAIVEFGQAIVTAGGHKLCLQILKHTAATVDGVPVKVGELAGFNRRYVGNYGELFFALYHAIRVNFGPMIMRLIKGADPLDALGGLARKKIKR